MSFDRQVEITQMNYTHITREERYQIYALKKAGHKQYEIAEVLKRSESTISRELSRNCSRRGTIPIRASIDDRAAKTTPKKVHTITSDNGKEFAEYKEITSKLKAKG